MPSEAIFFAQNIFGRKKFRSRIFFDNQLPNYKILYMGFRNLNAQNSLNFVGGRKFRVTTRYKILYMGFCKMNLQNAFGDDFFSSKQFHDDFFDIIAFGGAFDMLKLFLMMILSLIIVLSGCGHDDSPEIALEDIKIALDTRDDTKLANRVDLDEFFSKTYDVVTVELAKNYDSYQKKYPDDPYFQHDADFIANYNAEHKNLHLKFLRGVIEAYFAKISAPKVPEDNPTAYVANEFELLRQVTNITIKKTSIDGDFATVEAEISGDNSLRGRFIGKITFELVFHRDEKNIWHLDAIKNLDELTPVLVDKAELVWITFF